jgi:hypothetical protein
MDSKDPIADPRPASARRDEPPSCGYLFGLYASSSYLRRLPASQPEPSQRGAQEQERGRFRHRFQLSPDLPPGKFTVWMFR